jgi:hypothetical protein
MRAHPARHETNRIVVRSYLHRGGYGALATVACFGRLVLAELFELRVSRSLHEQRLLVQRRSVQRLGLLVSEWAREGLLPDV